MLIHVTFCVHFSDIHANYIDRRMYHTHVPKCLYFSGGKSESIGKSATEFAQGYSTESLIFHILANECGGTFSVSNIP